MGMKRSCLTLLFSDLENRSQVVRANQARTQEKGRRGCIPPPDL